MSTRIITGTITLTAKKEGFVRSPDLAENESVFIAHDDLSCALHQDKVQVEILGKKRDEKRKEDIFYGKVIEVIERSRAGYAGVIEIDNGMYFVVPQDKKMYTDILIPNDYINGATVGAKVIVKITKWLDPKKSPMGEVVSVLGRPGENNAEMLAYALERGFSPEHRSEVNAEAREIGARGITEDDIKGRRDFRDVLTCTIDPSDAKDYDDALSFKKLPNGNIELGVHIADVSYYVKQGTALDDEAVFRQTSVYLVDRCVPMLPEILSNDLCSLVEGKDRLVMSAVFELNSKGEVMNEWYGRAVIHSAKRFTYEAAQKVIDDKSGFMVQELTEMMAISKHLYQARFDNGALSLESNEVKFRLDENGVPVDVYVKERIDTMKMIEEYMLLANKYVSKFITSRGESKNGEGHALGVYRIHDKPNPDKMHKLDLFINQLGYKVKFIDGLIKSQELNALLAKMPDGPARDLLQVNITRSMEKAIYSTKNVGHYGLAFDYYSHFTSPIRRYPDVLTHRLLMRTLTDNMPEEKERAYFESACQHASRREKEAVDAERGSIKYKQVEYMSYRVGQTFEGVVSGCTDGGIFVEEKSSRSEGMVRMRDLGKDFFVYDREKDRVIGERTGVEYKIGVPVKIKVKSADLNLRVIDYELAA